jgi:acyl-CoA thioester hydrolase
MLGMEEELEGYAVQTELKVQWGDMDAARHVNNIVYLKWFETARVDYFDHLGQDVVFDDEMPGFILAKQDIKYLFPVTYPDKVILAIRVSDLGEDRFEMSCKILSLRHQRLVAIARGTVVTYDYQAGTKVPIPEDLRERIIALEGITEQYE